MTSDTKRQDNSDSSAFAVIALWLLFSGCGPSFPPVQHAAANSLDCSSGDIEARRAFSNYDPVQIVSGCGKEDVLVLTSLKWNSLRDRAAFEFSCSTDQLDVIVLSANTYGVSGCGQKAVYKFAPMLGIVIESHSRKNAPPLSIRQNDPDKDKPSQPR